MKGLGEKIQKADLHDGDSHRNFQFHDIDIRKTQVIPGKNRRDDVICG
jgi:hypothetical protein